MESNKIKVRFAPSPTGYLHVGGLRTALYNYLFAKKNNYPFVLRIEDTDRNRYVEGAEEQLINSLKWANVNYDEGPDIGGENAPYRQSERLDIYKKYADKLIENGKAYYCFCSAERLKDLRDEQQRQKMPQVKYDKHCLSLSPEEIRRNIENGIPRVVRLNVTPGPKVLINDIIRGLVEFDRDTIDDQVLIKSDGYPTYHMANVVDDHLMNIKYVIRGEEWLPSTPKHILLYQHLGWELPLFAHLPLLLNPDRSKLSKRQGDVAVEDYRDKGYLREALINFVALLGWSAGDNQEIFTMQELIEKFSLERVNNSGAVFNIDKLNWLNEQHMKLKDRSELLILVRDELNKSPFQSEKFSDAYLLKVIEAMIERVTTLKDFVYSCRYFYEAPDSFDPETVSKRWKEESPLLLSELKDRFASLSDPRKSDYEESLREVAGNNQVGAGKLIHPLRLAVSGVGGGPGVFDIVDIIGHEETISRIDFALANIK